MSLDKKVAKMSRLAEQKAKLLELSQKRKESQALNRKDVHLNDTKKELNMTQKMKRKRAEAEKLLEKQEVEAEGNDWQRHENLKYSIDDVERWEAKQEAKREMQDKGFTDYAQIAAKKYRKTVAEFTPDLEAYDSQKSQQGFYRDANHLSYAHPDHKPSKEGLARLALEIEKQDKRRGQFSRRREFKDDEDVYLLVVNLVHTLMNEICGSTKRLAERTTSIQKRSKQTWNAVLHCKCFFGNKIT
jgi:pre-mRNA-splicing factor SYF2